MEEKMCYVYDMMCGACNGREERCATYFKGFWPGGVSWLNIIVETDISFWSEPQYVTWMKSTCSEREEKCATYVIWVVPATEEKKNAL